MQIVPVPVQRARGSVNWVKLHSQSLEKILAAWKPQVDDEGMAEKLARLETLVAMLQKEKKDNVARQQLMNRNPRG